MDDYAVIIGISRYPGLTRPGGMSFDLLGPDRDADAIRDWLISPTGGQVNPANLRLIKTAGFPAPAEPWEAQPAQGEIRKAFLWLHSRGFDANGTRNGFVGRRLYVYCSGHGFQKETKRPALLTAEAIPENLFNLYAHGWVEWFRGAGYFQEYVVWADCCNSMISKAQVVSRTWVKGMGWLFNRRHACGRMPRLTAPYLLNH